MSVDKTAGLVVIMPQHKELTDPLELPIAQLAKHFDRGNHVKVLDGPNKDSTGHIVALEGEVATVLTDITKKTFKALVGDLRRSEEVSAGRIKLGEYELHDMITFSGQNVGVIVRVDRDGFQVLDTGGQLKDVKLKQVVKKNWNWRSTTLDSGNNSINKGDRVSVQRGQFGGILATIKHIFRQHVFLFSREVNKNSGIFAAKSRDLALLGGKRKNRFSALDNNNNSRGGGGGPRGIPKGARTLRDHPLRHQTVKINKGRWRGYIGIVKNCNDTTARVELHANCKTVPVKIGFVTEINGSGSASKSSSSGRDNRDVSPVRRNVPATPMRPSTPMVHHTPSTPSRDVWNPTATPLRSETPTPNPMSDRSWNDDRSPETPGSNAYGSNQYPLSRGDNDQPPATPGDPYLYPPTTPGTIREPATPGVGVDMSYNPTTPVGIPSTPGIPQTPGTPGMVSLPPRTPGTPGMMPPSTPGAPPTPFGAPQTPGMPSTPGMHSMVPTTPMGIPSTPGTPGMMMPQTPGTPGVPATPGTPGMMPPSTPGAYTIEPAAPSNASWVLPNIEVKITDNDFAGGKFANSTGVISQVDGDTCLVNFDGEEVQVPTTILDKTVPKNKSFVVVVSGNDRGAIGRLMGIDQTEAIVRLDGTYDLLIVPFNTLARFVKSEES